MENIQIQTRLKSPSEKNLVTELTKKDVPPLKKREVLAEVLYVPIHGSFWLASDPKMRHPRIHEFLRDGGFVFGNGGVAKVLKSKDSKTKKGDVIAVFGHIPCSHKKCPGCRKEHRYVECDYGEGRILGHGKGAPDGTYARYVVLPKYSYEKCFSAKEKFSERELLPMMYAFLLADVRNAMTRNGGIAGRERMLLIGAGQSGLMAAKLFLEINNKSKVLAVDIDKKSLKNIYSLNIKSVRTFHIKDFRKDSLESLTKKMQREMLNFFDGKKCDFVFDASSGNTAPLWANEIILSPGCLGVQFGFGSNEIRLPKALLQKSGLTIRVSRGVGNIENRRKTIELLKQKGWKKFVEDHFIKDSQQLESLEDALSFIRQIQQRKGAFNRPAPRAYIVPNGNNHED